MYVICITMYQKSQKGNMFMLFTLLCLLACFTTAKRVQVVEIMADLKELKNLNMEMNITHKNRNICGCEKVVLDFMYKTTVNITTPENRNVTHRLKLNLRDLMNHSQASLSQTDCLKKTSRTATFPFKKFLNYMKLWNEKKCGEKHNP